MHYLFSDYDLRGTLENQNKAIQSEVDSFGDDRLLNTGILDMVEYLYEKHIVTPIQLDENAISVDQAEAQINVSGDRNRYIRDRSGPFYIKGTSNKFFIPFSGDEKLFKCQPSTFTYSPPAATIAGNELILTYQTTEQNAEEIRSSFDRDLNEIKKYISWIERDVTSHNSTLKGRIEKIVSNRRDKILANRGLASSLGFPMRERSDAPKTYSVPEVRRKPAIRPPKSSSAPFEPEPALDLREYEHILSVIDNMVLVMERSPHAFSGMGEEDIRQHFLVQLNGHYEGQATGETFNYEGKTDILIRSNGKNIFIGECKFWRGPQSFSDTIDQILGYSSWRDTKNAILLFNRNKNLSSVLGKVPEICKEHTNFKRFVNSTRENSWRAIFSHKDDPDRELTITVNVYDIPSAEKS